jgi:hypothetical protein
MHPDRDSGSPRDGTTVGKPSAPFEHAFAFRGHNAASLMVLAVSRPDEVAADRDGERLRAVIENGSELTGATAGALVGLIGGPPGAAAGAAAGFAIEKALRRIGLEVYDRLVVRRQQVRVGAALGVMEKDAAKAAAMGRAPRTDRFFDEPGDGRRSHGEEILEGTLRAAADAYEERKLRHIAAIFPSVAVREDVSASRRTMAPEDGRRAQLAADGCVVRGPRPAGR